MAETLRSGTAPEGGSPALGNGANGLPVRFGGARKVEVSLKDPEGGGLGLGHLDKHELTQPRGPVTFSAAASVSWIAASFDESEVSV